MRIGANGQLQVSASPIHLPLPTAEFSYKGKFLVESIEYIITAVHPKFIFPCQRVYVQLQFGEQAQGHVKLKS